MSEFAPLPVQDQNQRWLVFLVNLAGQWLIASFFVSALPPWMPIDWALIGTAAALLDRWCVNSPGIAQWPPTRRLVLLRATYWLLMGCVGTAVWLLYVPGNLGMQATLNIGLLCMSAVAALRTVGDFTRTAVGVMLCILPVSTRYLAEGSLQSAQLGIGGYLITAALVMLARGQYRALQEQFSLRQRAERAADAMAAMSLAKARFFAAASHDLRQPVHAIGLYAETLATQPLDAAGRRALEGVHGAWQALQGLLGQVLELARTDAGSIVPDMAPHALAPLLAQLASQHGAAAERAQVRIVVLCPPRRWAQADGLMLHRLLSNLLDNAIKYSPAGACVVLAVRQGSADRWRVQVRDAGPGIAAEDHERAFLEFERVDGPGETRPGQGLGLSIVQRFAQKMQAPLTLRSAPDRGTTVTLVLAKAQPMGSA